MIYKVSSRGEEVKKIQSIVGVNPDGFYGPKTMAAVIAFQRAHGLNADGIVGSLTWRALFGESIPEPEQPKIFYQRQCMSLFGDPHESSFAHQWLETMQLHRWKTQVHKWMVEPLHQAIKNLNDRGLIDEWKTFDGCWNVRYMKGGSSLSIHSWGLAIDINAAENPFNTHNFKMSRGFAQCFKDAGLVWGGDWTSPCDAMHFQLPRVR